ncbi:MAG: hypothetical protein DCC58_03020 [Chloroflexi bacterium]|nr:MAG: hypothetical protein DCC58_03020 [Chloroflexota bacterium]
MTIAAFEAQASWLPTVVGMDCALVRQDEHGLVSLYFGELRESADGEPDAERVISFDGAWRLEQGAAVLAGSDDPFDEREELLEELEGKSLEGFEVSRPGFDLTLRMSDGYVVRCFPIDSLEFAEEVDDPDDAEVSWWVSGDGVPDDWESGREE